MSTLPAAEHRTQHLRWLLEVTQIPTASGREWRVVDWLRRWVATRPELVMREDQAGNLVIEPIKPWTRKASRRKGPLDPSSSCVFITAHMDHPAFVVERVVGPGTVELSFRGGVMDIYFQNARIVIHTADDGRLNATLTGSGSGIAGPEGSMLFPTYIAELDDSGKHHVDESDDAAMANGRSHEPPEHDPLPDIGDVATWALPPAEVDESGLVHTHACDDLAALAAALSAYDTLLQLHRAKPSATEDVRLLFTRSEEIGFTGAIAACKLKTMPKGARVIALENSRAFSDSPIGGGPIVRVGDRMSIFDPRLTAACAKRAEHIAGAPATPSATQKTGDIAGWKWQRKLMAGGACEATVFCAFGYSATCLCLPLGNYHNMAHLAEAQAGTFDVARFGPLRVAREFIHRDDYFGLVDLLVAIGQDLPAADPVIERIEKLYAKTKSVLNEGGPWKVDRPSQPVRPKLKNAFAPQAAKRASKPRSAASPPKAPAQRPASGKSRSSASKARRRA